MDTRSSDPPHLCHAVIVDLLPQVLQTVLGSLDGLAVADVSSITNVQGGIQLRPVGGVQALCESLMFGMQIGLSRRQAGIEAW
jgi:hypothetical protein